MKNWESFLASKVEDQIQVLNDLHNTENLTTAQIGEKFGTYANKVRRHAAKIGFVFRNRSEAQSMALATGRIEHPTAGRQRTEEEKIKIGQSVSDKWGDISDEERERRSEVAKENWNNRSQDQIDEMHRKATKKRLEVAKDGSKLEHFVVSELINRGFQVEFHKEQSLLNEKVHLDIWLPKLNTAVEIDGPTHFEPIWGEEHLKKTQKTDNIKDGLLLNAGCCIVRLRQKKNLSKTYGLRLVSDLVEILNKIGNKFPELGERRIVLGDKYD
jgi:hypothetical protein